MSMFKSNSHNLLIPKKKKPSLYRRTMYQQVLRVLIPWYLGIFYTCCHLTKETW